jgi:hypothetical protein
LSYISELQDVIRKLHGVESRHLESVPVKEEFQGKTVWEGIVEVFEIHGHPKASRIYAWSHETDDPKKPRRVTVLHIAPITSAAAAVRAAIVQEFRASESAEESYSRKPGRPKLPKGEAKGRIVPVRFTADDLKAMEAAAKASNQTLSEWIRSTTHAAIAK